MNDLPDDLESAVTDLLLVTGQLTRRLRAVANARELTWSQMAIITRLGLQGPLTTADLARSESVKPQSMGVALGILEQDGLVARQPHPSDGRQVLFALTDEGIAVRRQARLAQQEWLRGAVAKLSGDEQRTLVAAIALFRRIGES
jgi:DNA-binding MarR family transcriptional regulator